MKQHYDLAWKQGDFGVYGLVANTGDVVAMAWSDKKKRHGCWAYCVKGKVFGFRKTLAAAKRAAITRLMASTEEL